MVVPVAIVEARPVPETVATAGALEVQVAVEVRFWVVPSVYVPVAVNCLVRPLATDGLAGVTATETNNAGVTLKVVEAVTVPEVARIMELPVALAVARPVVLIDATVPVSEAQVTAFVRF